MSEITSIDGNRADNNSVFQAPVREEPRNMTDDFVKIMANIQRPEAPVYDENREKRLETMSSASGIAQALSVLGDAFGLQKGATVRPSNIQPSPYVDQIMADKDKFQNLQRDYESQDYARRLQEATGMLTAQSRDVTSKEARYRTDVSAYEAEQRRLYTERQAKIKNEAEAVRQAADITKGEEQTKYYKSIVGVRAKEAENVKLYRESQADKASGKTAEPYYRLSTPQGDIGIRTEDELTRIKRAILNDPTLQVDKAAYQELKEAAKGRTKDFVSGYWDSSPAARELMIELYGKKSPPTSPFSLGKTTSASQDYGVLSPAAKGEAPLTEAERTQNILAPTTGVEEFDFGFTPKK